MAMEPKSSSRDATVVLDGFSYLECPRWRDGRLWVSDFYTHQVVATDARGGTEVVAEVPGQPAGLGFLPDGRALIASMRDHRILVRDGSGRLGVHADLSGAASGMLNDMVVDHRGRAYVGNFGFDLMGGAPLRYTTLARVDADGTVTTVAEDLGFPNGMVILPDGVLVVAETFAGRLTAFDIDEDGGLGNRRVWAQFCPTPRTDDVGRAVEELDVAPDGLCADAAGALWVADALHGRVLRVREGGEILEEIATGTGVFACMLGGDDGRTLFLCTAPSFAEHERRAAREAELRAVRVDVAHDGLP
ncbi:SMP-30/gluconolactonase/LRE family protein [Streptomonospora wellingtoniae]|uniref:SMP-30/gluconolactonase/LRE family protein n=1 Tax=Streptomonospora wellingtoniae TaxID=3075544 RepID=A0ABU2L062_9ACTN|nr:SMP-30/gluconolactonase/LRE family protein [Streptomonospora sp. DSM 45055]MDT0304945.1 SMP-30/gluconolactonase/LRE family protein [Streptomonospora sp. DSM 45055]